MLDRRSFTKFGRLAAIGVGVATLALVGATLTAGPVSATPIDPGDAIDDGDTSTPGEPVDPGDLGDPAEAADSSDAGGAPGVWEDPGEGSYPGCATLVPGMTCTFSWQDGPFASVDIDPSVRGFTAIVTGAAGAPATDNRSAGGVGGSNVVYIDSIPNEPFTISLGQQGNGANGGSGWSSGGDGGIDFVLDRGGGGGGSTAIGWGDGIKNSPLLVAAGGGGGGACETVDSSTCYHGGDGGAGGAPSHGGAPGANVNSETNGNGGAGGDSDSSGRSGQAGDAVTGSFTDIAGGGGGGGGWHGGYGGYPGGRPCGDIDRPRNQCVKEEAGDGGGGGGGASAWDRSRLSYTWNMLGSPTHGTVTLIASGPTLYACVDSEHPRTLPIPAGVDGYAVLAVGGSGSRGHNGSYMEGRGAAVTGMIDTRGLSELDFFVGCSAYEHGGKGWGTPGHGGTAPPGANDGGDGGGATLVGAYEGGSFTPLLAAGGGGGAGGDACPADLCISGGSGGDGGGVAGTSVSIDGQNGSTLPETFFYGRGGCGGCVSHTENGGQNGTSSGRNSLGFAEGGGGGGGGAGFPNFGHGGGTNSGSAAAGGGGAGSSYLSPSRVTDGYIGTDNAYRSGFIVFIPFSTPTTTLTVTKSVTGDGASFGAGPFTVQVTCQQSGRPVFDDLGQVTAAKPAVFEGVPQQADCTVIETQTGGATDPPDPHIVTIEETPATVDLTNGFDLGSFTVDMASLTGDGGSPVSGISFDPGPVTADVACTFNGANVPLAAPVANGVLTFDGTDTFASGGQRLTVTGAPVGADCQVRVAALSEATAAVTVDGHAQTGTTATFTVGATPVAVAATQTFPVAPLAVDKVTDGSGTAPAGHEYEFAVACTYRGAPVTLPAASTTASTTAGGTAEFANLPVGASCTVRETDAGGATAVHYSPSATVTVESGSSTAVKATNTFAGPEPLTVTLSNSGPGSAWANTGAVVRVACTLGGTALPDSALTFPAGGGTQTVDVDDGAECRVANVTEVGQRDVQYSSSGASGWHPAPVDVTVAAGGGSSLAVEAVFDAAPVVVTSTNSGPGATHANTTTAATIDHCTFNGHDVPIDGGASTTITFGVNGGRGEVLAMVVGAECRVAQSTSGGASEVTYAVTNGGTADATGASIVVQPPAGGEPTTVAIDNVYGTASLAVSSSIGGEAAWAANVDTRVTVTCTFNGLPVAGLGEGGATWLDFAPTGESRGSLGAELLATLPAGAECTAAQSESGATSVEYRPAAAVTVDEGSTLEVAGTFAASSHTLRVDLSGNDAASHADDTFHIEQACTFNGQRLNNPPTALAWSAHVELAAGEERSFAGLPVGAQCRAELVVSNHATTLLPGREQVVTHTGEAASMGFDARFDVTQLTLEQVVDGEGAATHGAGRTFVNELTCRHADDATRVLMPDLGLTAMSAETGWSRTFTVPVGAECAVWQSDPTLATARSVPAATVTGAEPLHLTVTNTYRLGTITVTAEATGQAARGPDAARATFEYVVMCVFPLPVTLIASGDDVTEPVQGVRSLTELAPAADVPLADGTTRFTLAAGESRTLEALVNTTCAVTQIGGGGAGDRLTIEASGTLALATGDGATVKVRSEAPASIRFVNHLGASPGGLSTTGGELGAALPVALALLAAAGVLLWEARRRRA